MPRTLSAKLALLSILLSLLLASWIFWCFHDTKQALLTQKKQDISILLDRTADYVRLYSEGLNANLLALSSSLDLSGASLVRAIYLTADAGPHRRPLQTGTPGR